MTREEAAKYFKRHIDLYCVTGICREAEEMAIEVLEQEPCEDCISRQAAIDEWKNDFKGYVNALNIPRDDYNGIMEYIDELPSAQSEQQWIPVSERLPESDEDVLVTNGIGMYIGWIEPTDKGWRVDSESEYFMDDIVAWMPLPQPYKAESEVEK